MAVLRNVSKTDTLEIQRQKINALANDVYQVTGGSGSVVLTDLKLADGTKEAPSLSFSSESRTGIYKSDNKLSFANLATKIFDIDQSSINSLQNLNFYTSSISTSTVDTRGSSYYTGTYTDIPLTGGSGTGAVATIVVNQYYVNITQPGAGYPQNGNISVTLINSFTTTYTVTLFETKPADTQALTPPEYEYRINGVNQNLILTKGNTYKFDISDASVAIQPFHFELDGQLYINPNYAVINRIGSYGQTGSFIQVIIKPAFPNSSTLAIVRDTPQSIAVGLNITAQSGTLGSYGSGAIVDAIITGGVVTGLNFSDYGVDYKVGDVLGISNASISFAATPPSPVFSGTITALGAVASSTITNAGNGYEPNDILTVSNTYLPIRSYWQLSLVDHYQIVFSSSQTSYYWRVGDQITYNSNTPKIVKVLGGTPVNTTVSTVSITTQGTGYINGTYSAVSPTTTSGSGSQFLLTATITGNSLSLSSLSIANGGIGYNVGDTLTFPGITVGSNVGPVRNATDTSAADPARTPSVNSNRAGTGGTGTGARFNVNVSADGSTLVSIANPGTGYTTGDVITIPASSIGGTGSAVTLTITAFVDLVLTVGTVGSVTPVHSVVVTNTSNLLYVLGENATSAVNSAINSTVTAVNASKQYYLNDGIYPTYTLSVTSSGTANYVFTGTDSTTTHASATDPIIRADKGDVLVFNVNASGHPFWILDTFNGTTFVSADAVDSVTNNGATSGAVTFDTSKVNPGTYYYVCQNHAGAMNGTIIVGETSNSYYVDSVTLSKNRRYQFDLSSPSNSGYNFVFKSSAASTTRFTADYITYDHANGKVIIQPNDNTPTTLYFSAEVSGSIPSPDYIGGYPQDKGVFVISGSDNYSGSGYSLRVNSVNRNETVNIQASQGNIIADNSITSSSVTSSTGTFTTQLVADLFNFVNSDLSITGNNNLNITTSALNDIVLSTRKLTVGGFNVLADGSTETNKSITITDSNLNLSGSTSQLSLNQQLALRNNQIRTLSGVDLEIVPAASAMVKITSTRGLTIPAGTTLERPNVIQRANGTIRFNTDTNQYEGFNSSTSSWSSLGGVRDLDGNTYILPEAFAGANDNTLYFHNDSVNTIRLTRTNLDFWNMKTISSSNVSAPTFSLWAENTPVSIGQYLRYRNNIYVVTVAGITSDSTNPPLHTTGAVLNNTAELTWNALAVDDLSFNGIKTLKISPNADFPAQFSNEIQIYQDKISTLANDLKISPFTGKKVVIDTTTSFVVPSGTTLQRGIASRGSVRYNTTDLRFEGYDGSNWSSLGGVRDVDGNTYIIPETSAGSNENTLYFVNDGNNSMRLSTTQLVFDNVNIINSVSNLLSINSSTINVNNSTLSLTTNSTSTKFTSTSDELEFAISSGLNADTIFKLNDSGAMLWNKNWGTGSANYIQFLKNDLSEFKLRDVNIISKDIQLIKGTTDSLPVSLYSPTSSYGAKVVISADNVTANHREIIEYTITHKGSDIYHTEFGNITTGQNIFSTSFSFDSNNGDVVITPSLNSNVTASNVVNITVVITLLVK